MHDRDMLWNTADGRTLKLREITYNHLCNILEHIDSNLSAFINKYGEDITDKCKYNILQEIRLRKLKKLKNE